MCCALGIVGLLKSCENEIHTSISFQLCCATFKLISVAYKGILSNVD